MPSALAVTVGLSKAGNVTIYNCRGKGISDVIKGLRMGFRWWPKTKLWVSKRNLYMEDVISELQAEGVKTAKAVSK